MHVDVFWPTSALIRFWTRSDDFGTNLTLWNMINFAVSQAFYWNDDIPAWPQNWLAFGLALSIVLIWKYFSLNDTGHICYLNCQVEIVWKAWPQLEYNKNSIKLTAFTPDSKVHGANMGPIWGPQDPVGPHVGAMDFAIWDISSCIGCQHYSLFQFTKEKIYHIPNLYKKINATWQHYCWYINCWVECII